MKMKPNIARALQYTLAVAGSVLVIVLLVSGTSYKKQQLCNGIIINIGTIQGKVFVDEHDVKQLIRRLHNNRLEGLPVSSFDLRKAEHILMQDVWIHSAQLYFDRNGILHANISERYPVARVFDVTGNSYYLDTAARRLPLSNTDRADVPVFTGMMTYNKNNDSLFHASLRQVVSVAKSIEADDFWLAQAAQINIEPGNKYTLYPAIGSHRVELGNAEMMEDKLRRLKIFYRQVYGKDAFTHYSKISVAYKGQLVAVAGSDSARKQFDPQKAVQVFNQLVQINKTETNARAVEADTTTTGRIMHDNDATPVSVRRRPTSSKPAQRVEEAAPVKADTANTNRPKAIMPRKNLNN